MKNLNMKEARRIVLAFADYATETKKFHDVGNYEFIARCIKEADKKIDSLEMEIAADDRNVNDLMDQLDSLGKELEAKGNVIKEARGLISISVIELEANNQLMDELEEFKNKAFEAYPNIDRDIELLTNKDKEGE